MKPGQLRSFAILGSEAVRDAARRRVVLVIVGLSLLSLLMIDACSSCGQGALIVNEATVDPSAVGAVAGIVMVCVLSVWIVVLAGVLAADQLAKPISDGTAPLWLARPVTRETFALAQLGGALAIAWATAGVLVGTAAVLLARRQGLDPGPGLRAGGCAALNAVTVASLAMLASLWLPRMAIALLVLGGVSLVAALEAISLTRIPLEGAVGAIVAYGPPVASAPLLQLAAWLPSLPLAGEATPAVLRAGLWAAGSVALLLVVFRRLELRD